MQLLIFIFSRHVQGDAKPNIGDHISRKFSEDIAQNMHESCLSSPSCVECLSNQKKFHGLEAKPVIDHYSDDSDSEIFRVKRRSSAKMEKRNANDASFVKHFDHQVSCIVLSKFFLCVI